MATRNRPVSKRSIRDKGVMSQQHKENISKGMLKSNRVKAAAVKRGKKMKGKKRK